MNTITQFLQCPYPRQEGLRGSIKSAVFVGLFIYLFLEIFQPFGLSRIPENKSHIFAGYGLITMIVMLIFQTFIPKVLKTLYQRNWTIFKEIVQSIGVLFIIGLCNFLYTAAIGLVNTELYTLLLFQFFTILIGAIPITVQVFIEQNRALKQNLQEAVKMNERIRAAKFWSADDREETVTLVSENEKNRAVFNVSDLLYIHAADNYVEIHFLENKNIRSTLLRNSLKRIEEQITDSPSLLRCHRAYIVNISRIEEVEGNSDGYKLTLNKGRIIVPVSRSYTRALGTLIK